MDTDKNVQVATVSTLGDVPEGSPMSVWRRVVASQEFWITLAVVAMGLIVSMITPHFATYTNLSNVLQNFCYIGILAIGMTPILITGGIDISVGAIMGLCGVVLGLLLQADWPLWAGLPATLLLGIALGAINGCLVSYLRLPPFPRYPGDAERGPECRSDRVQRSSRLFLRPVGKGDFRPWRGQNSRYSERSLRHGRKRAGPALPPDDDTLGPLRVGDRRQSARGPSRPASQSGRSRFPSTCSAGSWRP